MVGYVMLLRFVVSIAIAFFCFCVLTQDSLAQNSRLDSTSQQVLAIPPLTKGPPSAGKRVAVTTPQYAGTDLFHTVFLPADWRADGKPMPIIFEYTGNYFPSSGSTGEPQDAALGFGLCGGRYIWVSLPYVNSAGNDNAVTWWGDTQATVDYAKRNVPRIIAEFNADANAVFLCGFSRGAIGVNYIGLHDDAIAKLWTAFVSHDHFDGVKQWNTTWGSPLEQYRRNANKRLRRVAGRPYWVSQNGHNPATQRYIRSTISAPKNFTFAEVNTVEILGSFPNKTTKSAHTDRWLLKPSESRQEVWEWMNRVAKQ